MHELALPTHINQTGVGEFLDVVGKGGRSNGNIGPEIVAGHFAAIGDAGEYIEASSVSESLGNAMELLVG